MFNMDKITRTKLAMLVTLILMNIFATIALCYTMAVSSVTNLETGGDASVLNLSMVFAIVIAFMWVVALILFYEFKSDDIMRKNIIDLQKYNQMLKDTVYTPAAINPDVLTEGGIQGHIPPK